MWERGVRVKFHYTQPDFAELILAEQTYRVSADAGRAGHGLYVTSAAPGSMPDEQLRRCCSRDRGRRCSSMAWWCFAMTPFRGSNTSLAGTYIAQRPGDA